MGGSELRLGGVGGAFGCLGSGGDSMGQEGNLLETGSCGAPTRPDTPEGVPAARPVPQWHVTNGDMLLHACSAPSLGLIGSERSRRSSDPYVRGEGTSIRGDIREQGSVRFFFSQ